MPAFRYLALLALVIWLGGMILLAAVVAPSTFRVLQAADPATGRVVAGALFGDILAHFHWIAYGCGVVIAGCLVAMKFLGPPPHAFVPRLGLVVLMLLVAAYSGMTVSSEIARLQSEVSGPMNRLPSTDPHRARFDQLHRTSTALMTINMAIGLVLLFWYARE